jgi:predicted dehydrogenase
MTAGTSPLAPIRVALVGLGGISLEHFEKLARIPDVQVVGVCDLSESLVAAVCERFGVGPGFTDYGRMLAEARPDAVHVLAPPAAHPALVTAALEAGAHVLVEKPITPTWDDYVLLRDAAASRGLLLVENYNYRFMPAVERALEAVRSGAIGNVVNVDVSFGVGMGGEYTDPDRPHFAHALPGGAMQNFVSHPLSIALAFTAGCDRVSAFQRTLDPLSPTPTELRALIEGNGICAVVTVSGRARPAQFTFRVQGTEGQLDGDVIDGRLHVENVSAPLARVINPARAGIAQVTGAFSALARAGTGQLDYFAGFERLLVAFYDAVAGRGPAPVSIDEMDLVNRTMHEVLSQGRGT